MVKSFNFGSISIEYTLIEANRKTLGITVTPDLDVIVKQPFGADEIKVNKLLRKRAPWILKQQNFFMAYFPKQPEKQFVGGETQLYLGRQYRLRINLGEEESVKLVSGYITVNCKDKSDVKQLVSKWYSEKAEKKFNEYCLIWIKYFERFNVAPKKLIFQKMEKRWGSCTPKGNIILNTELIKAPKGCIEYVIVHELCHLVYFKHNQQFEQLQQSVFPTWQKWKNILEKVMA